MSILSAELLKAVERARQTHVLTGWERLSDVERQNLAAQLQSIHFEEIARLYAHRDDPASKLPGRDRIAPLEVLPAGPPNATDVQLGEDALRRGQVAALVVAGGQGTRLNIRVPKGTVAVGPVSGATLFQIHAEKVLALSRKYGTAIPFLVMTSQATHRDTLDYFDSVNCHGLARDQVHFFMQESMPSVDIATGRLLMDKPGSITMSPNGHGGTLTALADSGLLKRLKSQGIRTIFYFQVDNPLVKVCEPSFLGRHLRTDSQVSSKVVFKERPEEKVGVLAKIDGRCGILEYSDMPAELIAERNPDGTLTFRAGNPAIHIFSVPFLEEITTGSHRLEYHIVRKKIPHYDPESQTTVQPAAVNALKFELFIFDSLPLAERWQAVQCLREEEFAPLKNESGPDSLETLQAAMLARCRRWLEVAGYHNILASARVEISPLCALEPDDLVGRNLKIPPGDCYLR